MPYSSALLAVTQVPMTLSAQHAVTRGGGMQIAGGQLMAVHAIGLYDLPVGRPQLNWVGIVIRHISPAVPQPTKSPDHPFVRQAVGRVTLIARGVDLVAGKAPTVVSRLHDVAFPASPGTVGKKRSAGRIGKAVDPEAKQETQRHRPNRWLAPCARSGWAA